MTNGDDIRISLRIPKNLDNQLKNCERNSKYTLKKSEILRRALSIGLDQIENEIR